MTIKVFFKQVLQELSEVKKTQPNLEKMPKGCLLEGIDVELVKPIIVINEVFQTPTQWSCQGHENSRWDLAYIRFQEGVEAPKALVERLKAQGFVAGFTRPFRDKPEVEVFIIRSFNHDEITDVNHRIIKNKSFLKELQDPSPFPVFIVKGFLP